MAADLIVLSMPQRIVNERSALTVTARFRNRAALADVTPTNAYWRVDDDQVGPITDWTSITPATTISIPVTSSTNAILNDTRMLETKILTVMSDRGLTTQYAESMSYQVRNQPYYT